MEFKGIRVNVLRSTLGDCTNGGVTAKRDSFVLISDPEETPEIDFSKGGASTEDPAEVLVLFQQAFSGPDYNCAYKYRCRAYGNIPAGSVGHMYGGNHVDSSDARYTIGYSLPVHDRTETVAQYEAMSN